MNENNPTVASVAVRYGLITGLVLIIFSLITIFADLSGNQAIGAIGYVLLIVGIVLAMKSFKAMNGGFMSYGQGLGIGTLLSVVAGALSGLFMFIYMKFIDTGFMDKVSDLQRTKMEEQGLSDEQIDQAMEMSSKFMGPGMMFIWAILGYLLMGFIFSLVIAAIMKRNRPDYEIS